MHVSTKSEDSLYLIDGFVDREHSFGTYVDHIKKNNVLDLMLYLIF